MTRQLLIGTRFGIGVRDASWFEHRIQLFSAITLPSLLAQDDQNFFWAIFVDSALPNEVYAELESMLSPFEGRAFIAIGPQQHTAVVLPIAEERGLLDSGGYLLTARLDDDDAWHTDTVRDIRERVDSWYRQDRTTPGIGLTYENGLQWIMYDMLNIETLQKTGKRVVRQASVHPFSFPFHSMSCFFFARLAQDDISALAVPHSYSRTALEQKSFTIDIITNQKPMWLYCRHKQTVSEAGIQHAGADSGLPVSIDDLASDFGIDKVKATEYITASDGYGYCLEKGNEHHRMMLSREHERLRSLLEKTPEDSNSFAGLKEEVEKIGMLMQQISEDVIGDPAELLTRD